MSEREAIEAAIAAWNKGGVDAFLEHVSPEVEWRHPSGFPEGDVWRGREELRAQLHDQFDAVFDAGTVDVESVAPAPQGWFVGICHSVQAQTSGMDLHWEAWFVMTLEDELITRNRVFLHRDQAERAAGLKA